MGAQGSGESPISRCRGRRRLRRGRLVSQGNLDCRIRDHVGRNREGIGAGIGVACAYCQRSEHYEGAPFHHLIVSARRGVAFSLRRVEHVYVTRHLPDELVAPLHELFEVAVWEGKEPVPKDVLRRAIAPADGLLCMLTDEVSSNLLDAAPRLRVVSQMAVGVDNIDVDDCFQRGIRIGHTPDVLTDTVADTAFALLGSIVRRLPEGEKTVRAGEWGPWDPFFLTGGDLHRTTLGIVGMGRIGRAVAQRSVGFDMEVVYSAPRPAPGVEARLVTLDELLSIADHVILCVSLTEESRGMIGREQLELMRPTSYLVNVARGALVQTEALVEALSEGRIAGAALDVTDPEPLPPDHPLLDLDNCLVVPHIASASVSTRSAMASLAVENLIAGLRGEVMPAELTPG